jgi:hypothetical protein
VSLDKLEPLDKLGLQAKLEQQGQASSSDIFNITLADMLQPTGPQGLSGQIGATGQVGPTGVSPYHCGRLQVSLLTERIANWSTRHFWRWAILFVSITLTDDNLQLLAYRVQSVPQEASFFALEICEACKF